jgi:arylsulfatase A-like enzyme
VPTQVTGNVDVTPTLLALAGVQAPPFMDGRSMLPWLAPAVHAATPEGRADALAPAEGAKAWRDRWLVEYISVGTYYNDHSSAYDLDGRTKKLCGGPMPRGPDDAKAAKGCVESEGVGDGNCYFVDSTHSNTWRALRILNATRDWQYVEYDPKWQFNASAGPMQHYELYDVAADPYQMTNIYAASSDELKAELHAELSEYWLCKGSASAKSDCP